MVYADLNQQGASYFSGPRFMAFDAQGQLYLSLGMQNKVVMLPDRDRDGRADEVVLVADKLSAPQGLAFVDGALLVANQDGVVRLEDDAGRWPARKVTPWIKDLPSGGHTLKSLKLGADGYLYLNVGSSCNVCVESDPLRATILRYTKTGQPAGALVTLGRHAQSPVWARGLRNAQGFDWHLSGAMYATNDGSDMRVASKGGKVDDTLPPEHLNRIEGGQHYGWPHCWGQRETDPAFPGSEGFCAATQGPAATFPAHSTPIGIAFLDKSAFPQSYRNSAIVALHGSWNRQEPSGYKLVQVRFEGDQPVAVTDFMTGWLSQSGAWGRPVDVVVGPDGALYVSDDRAGLVYRVTYKP
ncbi:MAG TPA: PQQ-dependent sugar dehydrogenase [Methylophilaceae bacterium]|nr:PQQ-dependent sugar dehydrogenase [Methylophilaceae bacterium]